MLAMVSVLASLVPDEHPTGLADMVFRDAFPPRLAPFIDVVFQRIPFPTMPSRAIQMRQLLFIQCCVCVPALIETHRLGRHRLGIPR